MRRASLDRALAAGGDARRSSELRLRATQLTESDALHRAAAELEAVVDAAEALGPRPRPPAPLRTEATLEARAALLGLAQRLRDHDVVVARAAAMARELLSPDGPLYTGDAASIWDSAMRVNAEIDDARRLGLPELEPARSDERVRLGRPATALGGR